MSKNKSNKRIWLLVLLILGVIIGVKLIWLSVELSNQYHRNLKITSWCIDNMPKVAKECINSSFNYNDSNRVNSERSAITGGILLGIAGTLASQYIPRSKK